MSNVGVYPDAELVICSWISSIPGIEVDYVDHQLPWDLNVPVDNGYVQVTVINGAPDQNVPMFHTVAQIDCWVATPSEDRIYRLKASGLAKSIQYGAYDRVRAQRGLTIVENLPNGDVITYPDAHMFTVTCLSDPHQIVSKDSSFYEGYSMDMTFTWTFGMQVN